MDCKKSSLFLRTILAGLLVALGLCAAERPKADEWRARYEVGRVLYEKGNSASALTVLKSAAEEARADHAPELEYAKVLDPLGASFEAEGLLAEAKNTFEEGLAIRRRLLPAVSDDIAVSLTNLSSVYWTMVKPEDSVAYASEAKITWERLKQTNRREYAVAVINLLAAYRLKGRMKDMGPLMAQARETVFSALTPADPLFAESLSTLASAYRAAGDYTTAEKLSTQALAVAENKGLRPATRAYLMSGVADMRMAQGRLAEAEALIRTALELPPDNSAGYTVRRAVMYRLLGSVYRQQGRYEAAETQLRSALSLLKGKTGQESAERGAVLNCLGMNAEQRKQHKQAEHYFKAAIAELSGTFGSNEVNLSATYSNLAELYSFKHQYDRAKKLYEQVLATDREALSRQHPVVARDLNNLGVLAFNRHQWSEAQELFEQAYAVFCSTVGVKSLDAALTEANLANALSKKGEVEAARVHYVAALHTLDDTWGKDNPQLMNILAAYATFCRTNQDMAQAEELEVRMERIRVRRATHNEPNGA